MVTPPNNDRGPARPPQPISLARVARLGVIALVTIAAVLAGAWWLAPRVAALRPLPSLEESRRRVAAGQLERYGARARHGSFLPPAALTIAVHERFLQRSFAASLPFERTFDDGKILARLDSVVVDVADGATILTLRGRARRAASPDVYADLLIQGTLGIDDVDFGKSRMLTRLEFTDVRVLDSGPAGMGKWTNPVTSYFTHRSASDWNEFQPALPLPLQFATRVELPAVEGDVTLPAVALPVRLRLQAITALERRLAISIEVTPDTTAGAAMGPAAAPWDAAAGRPRKGKVHSEAEITRLRTPVLALSRTDSLWTAIRSTERDLVVVVPAPLLVDIVKATTAGYRVGGGVGVFLEPEIIERVDEEIKTKVLGNTVTAGTISANIEVKRLEGHLVATGDPRVRLVPPDGLTVELPLALEGGEGAASIDVEWDPKGAAWLVCKGFKARRELNGLLGRIEHRVAGTLRFAVEEGRIVGRSTLRRDRVRLPLDLTPASWGKVRDVFVEQDELLRCGMMMDPDRMVTVLRRIGDRGVKVRLPGGLPGFELPLAFKSSVIDSTVRVGVVVQDIELTMREAALCVGVDGVVALQSEQPPQPAPRPLTTAPARPPRPRAALRVGRRRRPRPPRLRGARAASVRSRSRSS